MYNGPCLLERINVNWLLMHRVVTDLILSVMKHPHPHLSTDKSWVYAAAHEFQSILEGIGWKRSWSEASRLLGIDRRTLRKLDPKRVDTSLSLETLDVIFRAAYRCMLADSEGNEDPKEIFRRLADARMRILLAQPTSPALEAKFVDEMNQPRFGTPATDKTG